MNRGEYFAPLDCVLYSDYDLFKLLLEYKTPILKNSRSQKYIYKLAGDNANDVLELLLTLKDSGQLSGSEALDINYSFKQSIARVITKQTCLRNALISCNSEEVKLHTVQILIKHGATVSTELDLAKSIPAVYQFLTIRK